MFYSIYMYMKCHVASSESACRQLDDYPSSTDTQYKTNQICKSFIFTSDAASKSRAIERRMHAIRRSRAFQRMHVMLDRFIHLQNLPRYMPGFLPSKAPTNSLSGSLHGQPFSGQIIAMCSSANLSSRYYRGPVALHTGPISDDDQRTTWK
jgi:hypothetical protein